MVLLGKGWQLNQNGRFLNGLADDFFTKVSLVTFF